MVSSGMKDAGYLYVNIDDCWHGERDAKGFIHPNAEHFPSGMKALADYVHAKGLKLGHLFGCRREDLRRPAGQPRPRIPGRADVRGVGHRLSQVRLVQHQRPQAPRGVSHDARGAAQGGPAGAVLLCEWGDNKPWDWAKPVGHSWRTTGDIWDCFDCVKDHGTWNPAASCRSSTCRRACACMPAPATGTMPT